MGKWVGFVIASEIGKREPVTLVCLRRKSFRSLYLRKKLLKLETKWLIAGNFTLVYVNVSHKEISLFGLDSYIRQFSKEWMLCHYSLLMTMTRSAAYLESQSFPQRNAIWSWWGWLSRLAIPSAMIFPRKAKDGLRIKHTSSGKYGMLCHTSDTDNMHLLLHGFWVQKVIFKLQNLDVLPGC